MGPMMRESRKIVADLLEPKAWIFWVDFLVCLVVTYSCVLFLFSLESEVALQPGMAGYKQGVIEAGKWWQAVVPAFIVAIGSNPWVLLVYIVAGFGLHRLANFIHEVAHLNARNSLPMFRKAWNLLFGIPAMMPSYFFEFHMGHHNNTIYGTHVDGEYLPIGRGPIRNVFLFLTQIFVQPVFVLFRFLVITPISFLSPGMRDWSLRTLSSFVFNFSYRRKITGRDPRRWWAFMDLACSIRAWLIPGLVIVGFVSGGTLGTPFCRMATILVLAAMPLSLHYFRSLTAHHWTNLGDRMSFRDQLYDSVDIVGGPLTEFVYPVGLRYHALHHMFPSMPYHNLGIAHRRLMAQLPADSPYRDLVYPSVYSVMKELFETARRRIPQQADSQGSSAEAA
ncbi:MAG: fatty acid desaturase [Pirellulales bacterium]|nr:fatty acid desaturase [Pirellulales bacterium]